MKIKRLCSQRRIRGKISQPNQAKFQAYWRTPIAVPRWRLCGFADWGKLYQSNKAKRGDSWRQWRPVCSANNVRMGHYWSDQPVNHRQPGKQPLLLQLHSVARNWRQLRVSHVVAKISVKELFVPAQVNKTFEPDFSEVSKEKKTLSFLDRRFLNTLESNVQHLSNDHYEEGRKKHWSHQTSETWHYADSIDSNTDSRVIANTTVITRPSWKTWSTRDRLRRCLTTNSI